MNDGPDRSLGLDEVAARFAESEDLLREASTHLTSLIEAEEQSQRLAGSLSESANAVTEYNASAKALLDVAREALAVLSGNALADLAAETSEIREQAGRIEEQLTQSTETQRMESRRAAEQTHRKIDTVREQAATKRVLLGAVGLLIVVQVAAAAVIILAA